MVLLVVAMILSLGVVQAAEPESEGEGSPRRVDSFEPERVQVEGIPFERVRMSVSVLDAEGRPVEGLSTCDFEILEAGVPQEIIDFGREFDREDRPLSVVLLVDRSASIGRQMNKWRYAGAELLSAMRPIDEIRISTFSDDVRVEQDFTNSREHLQAVVERFEDEIWGAGGTRIFKAVSKTFWDLRDRPGRKVVFLLTDGVEDRAAIGPTINNPAVHSLVREAIEWQITVVTILPGKSSYPYLAAQDLAIQTGGWWLYSSGDLPGLIRRLGERLLGSYYMAYDSGRTPEDLSRHRISVKLTRPDLEVRTVTGVWGQMPVLERLAEEIRADDEEDRVRAVAGLAISTEPDATRPLMKALKDDSPAVRAAALGALARRGDFSALGKIVRLLKDEETSVREAALDALDELMRVAPDEETRTKILDALESVAWVP